VSGETVGVRPDNLLCPVRDYNNLSHVSRALALTDTDRQDIVVMTVRVLRGPNAGYRDIDERELFTVYEQRLFSRVVALAEKAGKPVELLVVPSSDVFQATALTAVQLESVEIIAGRSAVLSPEQQARRLGQAWERVPMKPRHWVRFRVIDPDGRTHEFSLGAHAPQLADEDIDLIHHLWLDLSSVPGREGMGHRDVVNLALRHLAEGLAGPGRDRLLGTRAVEQDTSPGTPGTPSKRRRGGHRRS
jgi:hypothetical protein